ncbi:Lnb N-terminal periplasmic domain-containing protein [Xanthobacter agilis]|uniref:Lnb N-terminal periplasmic domain-containing protein n=1 Tax=Xanthobacter agilis TaxID=47492 RepID=UPI00372A1955
MNEAKPDHRSAAPPRRRSAGTVAAGIAIAITALSLGAWTAAALWYQAGASWRLPLMGASGIMALALAVAAIRHPVRGLAGLAVALAAVGLWWSAIAPSNDRSWAPDVSRGVTAEIRGSDVTLRDVRDFQWRTPDDFTPRWRTLSLNLDQLDRVDLYSSVWASPAIAHTLVGFGFSDGQYVVFSAEIRRELGEQFSEIGGFFKEFELVLIAATPDDIIHLRTDARGEHVTRYPLKLSPEQMRAAFLIFANKGNALAQRPEFYQTITTNCTTVVFRLARIVEPNIPFDWRILASGYLPGYLYDHRLIDTTAPLAAIERAAVVTPGTRPWILAK